MVDKNTTQPQSWPYPMMGMYPPQYSMYGTAYPSTFYPFFQGGMAYNGLQTPTVQQNVLPNMQQGLKNFTSGGTLMPFGHDQNPSQPNENSQNEFKEDIPPLPPGPPPPNQFSNQNQHLENAETQHFYQPNSNNGPIKFNMNNKRNGMGFTTPFNNSGSAKKKRKRNKNKFNESLQQSTNMQSAAVQFRTIQPPSLPPHMVVKSVPPLPPHLLIKQQQPPLPPGPPPPSTPPPEPESESPVEKLEQKPIYQSQTSVHSIYTALDNWPIDLQDYVNRSYQKCQTDIDKDRVGIILKGKICLATNEGSLWSKNWKREPLPTLESEILNMNIRPAYKPQVNQTEYNSQRKTPIIGKKGRGLSAALGSRLGVRVQPHKSRSNTRSKSRSLSRSPKRYRKSPPRKRRDRSESSTSSEDNFLSLKVNNKTNKGRNNNKQFSKRGGKGKSKASKIKSHFYSEMEGDMQASTEVLEKRAARFSNGSFNNNSPIKRKKSLNYNSSSIAFEDKDGDFDLSDCHIVGVCQDIEKPYLRLTAAPEPSAVRPPEILQQSLERVKDRWKKSQDYHYACEQLKSIRQDLTVQGIRDNLTVKVYETHARIALEKGDHAEFNQCQSQLKLLYTDVHSDNRLEFTAYRILYYIFTKEFMDLTTCLAKLSEEEKHDECISHALKLRSAWWLCNYHNFFQLYRNSPRMSSYVIDWFVARERKLALKIIIKSYVLYINNLVVSIYFLLSKFI
uniref:PCI domain-containing protein n=1 Tax=Clastoptera arizonana TaxID=38151 RepID=A0A1B6EDP6_9HEMI